MQTRPKILCVDDEKNVLHALQRVFMDNDYEILTAVTADEGLVLLQKESPVEIVLSDYRMPGMTGVDFLKEVYNRWPETIRIILSGYSDTAAIVSAINEGHIYKFIPKPWNDEELKITVANAVQVYVLREKNEELARELAEANDELTVLNESLQKLVAERTGDLVFQNKVLKFAQNILHVLPMGIIGLDFEGSIMQCNRYAFDCIGAGEPVIGKPASDILPQEILELAIRTRHENTGIDAVHMAGRRHIVTGFLMKEEKGYEGIILLLQPDECSENLHL